MRVWLLTAWKGAIYEVCPIDANSDVNKLNVCWCMNKSWPCCNHLREGRALREAHTLKYPGAA
jgi:hypothetical protein